MVGLGWLLAGVLAAALPPRPAPAAAPSRVVRIARPAAPVDPFFISDPSYFRIRGYAPDRYGYLRPRVIFGPDGAYYLYSGRVYPFVPVRPID
jgi:hypothetical protein